MPLQTLVLDSSPPSKTMVGKYSTIAEIPDDVKCSDVFELFQIKPFICTLTSDTILQDKYVWGLYHRGICFSTYGRCG